MNKRFQRTTVCSAKGKYLFVYVYISLFLRSQHPEENGSPVIGYTLEWMIEGKFVEVE